MYLINSHKSRICNIYEHFVRIYFLIGINCERDWFLFVYYTFSGLWEKKRFIQRSGGKRRFFAPEPQPSPQGEGSPLEPQPSRRRRRSIYRHVMRSCNLLYNFSNNLLILYVQSFILSFSILHESDNGKFIPSFDLFPISHSLFFVMFALSHFLINCN